MKHIALFGAGRIGQVHAEALRHLPAKIRYVIDAIPEAAKRLAQAHGATVCSQATALADPEIDAAIIASPTDTHAALIGECAKQGKAIFCEKPLDLNLSQARECAALIDQAGVPCALGFNRRFDPHFSRLKHALDQGQIGQLESLIITSRDPAPPPIEYIKHSGGLFRDMMIHDFDMARFLLNEPIREVFASGSTWVDPAIAEAGDIDTAAVTLRSQSGVLVMIHNSRRACYGYDQRLEAVGSGGMLQVANVRESLMTHSGEQGSTQDKPLHFFLQRYAEAYRLELACFLQRLESKQPMTVDHHDGVAALELADAAAESLRLGQVITLPTPANEPS